MPHRPRSNSDRLHPRPRLADLAPPDFEPIYDEHGCRSLTAEGERERAYAAQLADAITASASVEAVGEVNPLGPSAVDAAVTPVRDSQPSEATLVALADEADARERRLS